VTAELKPSTPRTTERPLTAAQSTRIRTRLVADLKDAHDLEAQLSHEIADGIESRRGSSSDEVDDPEGSNTAFEGAQARAMLKQTTQHAREISDALVRLDQGTYGVCSSCGGAIAKGRLEARPSTDHCISCAA
jgi:RNA polymerase-binding transcription factor DksA